MDNITLERVWEDAEIFQIEVLAESAWVKASVRSYTDVSSLKELSSKIFNLTNMKISEFIWENGKKGVGFTPYVSFACRHKDKKGHIQIEVYMEIDDGGSYEKHNCCFYIDTELGLLNKFGESLLNLNVSGIGYKVSLT